MDILQSAKIAPTVHDTCIMPLLAHSQATEMNEIEIVNKIESIL